MEEAAEKWFKELEREFFGVGIQKLMLRVQKYWTATMQKNNYITNL